MLQEGATLRFLKTLSIFTGTIIGVGIFGLPYVASRAGFWVVAAYFIIMSIVVITTHLFLGRVAFGTATFHRLPGYIEEYLGEKWRLVSFGALTIGISGALLAYLIVGGEFLFRFFHPVFQGSPFVYTFLFFVVGGIFVFIGVRSIVWVELVLMGIFFFLVALFFARAFPHIQPSHFSALDFKQAAFPYGVVLFSLWGSALVPEMKEMVRGSWPMLRAVVISGVLLAAATYLLFVVTVFGVSGQNTSLEAMSGFARDLGGNIVALGFLFGIITTFTSFLTLGVTLKKIFFHDFGIPKHVASSIALGIPFLLFLAGLREFLDIIGAVGAFTIGVEGVLIVFLYRKFLQIKFQRKMSKFFYVLVAILLFGMAIELYYFFVR